MNRTRFTTMITVSIAIVLLVGGVAPCDPLMSEACAQPIEAPPAALRYVKRNSREATRKATLEAYLPKGLEFGPWWIAGPFENQYDANNTSYLNRPYLPEQGFDPEAIYDGKNGVRVNWRRTDFEDNAKMDLHVFGDESLHEYVITYLYRIITVEEATDLEVTMGSDDALKAWLNGETIINADELRGWSPDQHRVTLNLAPGANEILVKVGDKTGGFDYSFTYQNALDPLLEAQLEYQLDLDFPLSAEDEYYRLLSFPIPDDVVLEAGGMDTLADGRPVIATRRGEVWIVEKAYADPPFSVEYKRFARGLHEPLGLAVDGESLYIVQRPELTRLVDTDGDDRADLYETFSDEWGVSGNYHEFAFGPKFDREGNLWVTLNVGFCGSLGKSVVPWRGWALMITPEGELRPVCGGLRSPNGIGMNSRGDMFVTDNQGDWIGTNKLSHLKPGSFQGHPASNRWYDHPLAPGSDPGKPVASPEGPVPMHVAAAQMSTLQLPAVWFPLERMGRSASDILCDQTGGAFGPFENQLFVGDQYSGVIMRIALEKVDGEYQGACFPFRSNFLCGVNRMTWGRDGSMFVGMTDRGWGSLGRKPYALERLVWTGKVPFEVHAMSARHDGFELTFTMPVDHDTASDPASYSMKSFTYNYHEPYGSDEIDTSRPTITSAEVAADGLSVRLGVRGLRAGYVHELHLDGVRSHAGAPLLHPVGYYTLNRIPADSRAASSSPSSRAAKPY